MAVAVTVCGLAHLLGAAPSAVTFTLAVLCVALAAVHRWVAARDERRMAARLQRSEAYFRSLVSSSGDAVVIVDDDLRVTWASSALDRAIGPAAARLVGRPLLDAVHADDVAGLAAAFDSGPTGLLLLRLQDGDGIWRELEAGVSDLRRHADVGAFVLHCRDMTERHARERALQSVAYTDPMTGLPNRAGLLQSLSSVLTGDDVGGTLLVLALDGLTEVREEVGREIASAVVAELGRRLRATVRGEDVVARMGGGAFAVLTAGTDSDADRLADRCLSVIEQPVLTSVGIVDLTAAVGLAVLEPGLGVDDLLARGDLAVRAARATGRGSAARYCPALGDAAARQDRLREALQGARDRGELVLLFQPIVSLDEQRVTGIEVTPHWRHPEFGEVPFDEFVLLAERSGLLGDVFRWALECAADAVGDLPSSGAPLRIGLKLPVGYLAAGTLVADVQHALDRSGLAPERFVLQLDADAVMSEDERVGLDAAALRFMGVNLALHGFGSESSALVHLTRLPVNIVKLDRAVVSRVDRDPRLRALCGSVVGIVRALELDVVAEGVDTPAQLGVLRELGVSFAQGYVIARPVPLGALAATLAETAGVLGPGAGSRV
jgi:diguanylate cyclase (GGDEF)-like protein/PAS domain S-box-containing protein